MTLSFLCPLMIRGHYAGLALWFLRPFLYSMMSFSTRGHPRRQSLYEAERLAFEAMAPLTPGLPARCFVTHELPCCSLTHRDIIRDSGQKNNTSLFSLGLSQQDPWPCSWQMCVSSEYICIWYYMWSKCRRNSFILRCNFHILLIWNSSAWWLCYI